MKKPEAELGGVYSIMNIYMEDSFAFIEWQICFYWTAYLLLLNVLGHCYKIFLESCGSEGSPYLTLFNSVEHCVMQPAMELLKILILYFFYQWKNTG